MKFTIDAIDGAQTAVTFLFDDGSKSTQNISNLPVDDEKSLAQALTDYATAYVAGLEIEKAAKVEPNKSLIGKTLDAIPADNAVV